MLFNQRTQDLRLLDDLDLFCCFIQVKYDRSSKKKHIINPFSLAKLIVVLILSLVQTVLGIFISLV